MASPNAPKMTQVEAGMVARAAGMQGFDFGGPGGQWFGPGTPMAPQAPEDVQGRAWDYPFATNLQWGPRTEPSDNAIDFPTLRRLADVAQGGLDLLRLAIETRKDQVAAQKWTLKPRDPKRKDLEAKAEQLKRDLFYKPDGVNRYAQWQRGILEDYLTIDAVSIYKRPTAKRGIYTPEQVDGATIKRVLDAGGRTPLTGPAYQQKLKGVAAVDYTVDELIYAPYNVLPYRIYALGRIEQFVGIVNVALRKQLSQLQFYTEGTVPDSLLQMPVDWQPDQIKKFQDWWDQMAGDQVQKRRMKMIPGGNTNPYIQLKDPKLKDETDEWFARIICWCYSLSPSALVKDMNRATGQTNKETAKEEGLEPLKGWYKDLKDTILWECYGETDFEFTFLDEEVVDPKTKADVAGTLVDKKIIHVDEAREQYGMDPLTDDQRAQMGLQQVGTEAGGASATTAILAVAQAVTAKSLPAEAATALVQAAFPDMDPADVEQIFKDLDKFEKPEPPPPVVVQGAVGSAGGAGTPSTKQTGGKSTAGQAPMTPVAGKKPAALAKAKRPAPLGKDRPTTRKAWKGMKRVLADKLGKLGDDLATLVRGKKSKTSKLAKFDQRDLEKLLERFDSTDWYDVAKALAPYLESVTVESAQGAVDSVKDYIGDDKVLDEMLSLVNDQGVQWAKDRAAEMVGKRFDENGQLVDNPDAKWRIDADTRKGVQDLVAQAEQEGWSNDDLADRLESDYLFSESRAETIARTETAYADTQGNLLGWRESGVVEGVESVLGSEHDDDDECNAAADMGVQPLDSDFGGLGQPPYHPRCVCDLLPVVKESDNA